MEYFNLAIVVLAAISVPITSQNSIHDVKKIYDHKIKVETDSVYTTVDEKYLSFTIDAIILDTTSGPKWQTFDFKSPRVRTLMKGLSPAYLRFGGTMADYVTFSPYGDLDYDVGTTPPVLQMNTTDWDNLVNLTVSAKVRLLYELNLQQRYGKQWDPTNAGALFKYLSSKGYGDNIDWEMGNEPDENAAKKGMVVLTGEQIAKDYQILRNLLNKYDVFKNCILVGPDTGSATGKKQEPLDFFISFVNNSQGYLDAATFHQYYMSGQGKVATDYIDPALFSLLDDYLGNIKKAVKNSMQPDIPLWIGETADANQGGTEGVTDRYVSGFLWLGKLGEAAMEGVKLIMRQTFYTNHYPLIGDDLYPNPDYWVSYIYKKLVDVQVFPVSAADTTLKWQPWTASIDSAVKDARFYAHCTKPSSLYKRGALTIFGLSVNTTFGINLLFDGDLATETVDIYQLTSLGPEGLTSRWIGLNGVNLTMSDDYTLPDLKPNKQPASSGIVIPPLSLIYMVFPEANIKACM